MRSIYTATELLGRRVVLRRRAGHRDGRPVFADVLGELIAVGEEFVVRRPDGSTVVVPHADVHRLKPIPPGRAEIIALEQAAAAGWPAPETERLGEWLLRAGEGWTRRANSALVLGDPGLPVPAALDRVRSWYAERTLPARICVPLPAMAPTDRAAARLGWELDVDTEVLTTVVHPAPLDPGVQLAELPSPEWIAAYQSKPVPPVGYRILTAPEIRAFGSIVEGGGTVAIGHAVVVGGWLGIAAVEVPAEHRRRGLAARMMRGLLAWGAANGATRCYLQVESANTPAIALYTGIGFTAHHRYRRRHLIR